MKNLLISCFIFFVLLVGCGSQTHDKFLSNKVQTFDYKDVSGQYKLRKKNWLAKKNRVLYQRLDLYTDEFFTEKPVERKLTVGIFSKLKGNDKTFNVLKPKFSKYQVWLEGKEYFSKIKIDYKKKKILLSYRDEKKDGIIKKTLKLPKEKGLYCFYSQLIECLKTTKFITKSIEKKAGQANINVIFDGHPILNSFLENINLKLIEKATFNFNGRNEKGVYSFSLNVSDQVLFYQFNKKAEFHKFYWISQGISQSNKKL